VYKSFEDMPVWQKAMNLATGIFQLTEGLPQKEDYGLTSQIRRSALSVSANISESFGRAHTLDKLNFYFNARGSLAETKSHLIYGHRVGYFNQDVFDRFFIVINDIWQDLNRVIATLKKKSQPQPQP